MLDSTIEQQIKQAMEEVNFANMIAESRTTAFHLERAQVFALIGAASVADTPRAEECIKQATEELEFATRIAESRTTHFHLVRAQVFALIALARARATAQV